MYFSDMYCDSQVSEEVREDDMLWGEGFGGALQWEELMEIATEIGFSPPMLVEVSPISIDEAVRSRIGMLLVCRLQWACIQYVLCVGFRHNLVFMHNKYVFVVNCVCVVCV